MEWILSYSSQSGLKKSKWIGLRTQTAELSHQLLFQIFRHKLNKAIARVIDDYSLVKFQPLDVSDEDSINDVLLVIDNILQYGEENDVKEPKEVEENVEPDENNKEIE